MDILLSQWYNTGQRGHTSLRRVQHHLGLRRRCAFSFVLIEHRPYLNHFVFGEHRDGMHDMDRGLTTRGHRSVVCAATPRRKRRRAWREESRRVYSVSNGLFAHKISWFVYLVLEWGKD